MSTSVELPGQVWTPPEAKPLDESVWQAWLAKGREQDRRSRATCIKAVKWVAIVGLLVTAGFWSYLAPYDLVVRFIVAACAMVMMFQAFHATHYAVAGLFGALALLYNPVTPIFSFSGDWQRAVVVASAVPFGSHAEK